MQNQHQALRDWFINFEGSRAKDEELPEDMRDPELLAYKERTSHSTDSKDSIEWRQEFMLRKFFEYAPNIELKDDQRLFSHEQRLAIFRRDQGRCQVRIKCDGIKCEWEAWEADHSKPWSKGGRTIVANGQVACIPCNSAKTDHHASSGIEAR